MILFESSSRYPDCNGVYMLREIFCGCPACTSGADVSVRKCHETLRRRRLLESHGLSETPIAPEQGFTTDMFIISHFLMVQSGLSRSKASAIDLTKLLLLSPYQFNSTPEPRMYPDHEWNRKGDLSPS